ncbi:MAG: DUF4382 domain-containing protein [Haloarculaceae archaeon]
MDRTVLLTALVVVAVVLAGCASSTGSGLTDGAGTTLTSDGPDGGSAGVGAATDQQATVNFYVSDAPIDDFAHLNVTVTRVGFQYAGEPGADDDEEEEEEEEEEESGDVANETATPEPNRPTSPQTETPEEPTASPTTTSQTDGDEAGSDDEAGGETGQADSEDEDEAESGSPDGEDGDEEEEEEEVEVEVEVAETAEEDGDSEDESAGWIERDVDNRTVDLTELTGPNATLIDTPEMPAGKYTKVFVYVSDVEGVLEDGSEVAVKLPSERLHLNTPFEVAAQESVDFVFDISVHKAGKSGKYMLKPVASASGVDQPIEAVGGSDGGPEEARPDAGPEEGDSPEAGGTGTDGESGAAETTNSDDEPGGDGGPPDDGGDGDPPED